MTSRNGYRELSMEGLREAVMDELAVQYSRSNIGMEEYDERCGKAAGSNARGELIGLVEDLPAIESPRDPGRADLPAVAGANAVYRLNRGRVPERDVVFNVFSGSDRKGVFNAPRSLQVFNVFGGSDIDLSQAALPPEGCVINVICVFGACDIKLPRGVNVDVRGIGVFGGFGKRAEDTDDPAAPLVRVNGIAVFGGCDVKTVKR
jgi:hypothetical protein